MGRRRVPKANLPDTVEIPLPDGRVGIYEITAIQDPDDQESDDEDPDDDE